MEARGQDRCGVPSFLTENEWQRGPKTSLARGRTREAFWKPAVATAGVKPMDGWSALSTNPASEVIVAEGGPPPKRAPRLCYDAPMADFFEEQAKRLYGTLASSKPKH
jgi:hypothetical protein